MTRPRPPGELEEGLGLEPAQSRVCFPPLHHQEREDRWSLGRVLGQRWADVGQALGCMTIFVQQTLLSSCQSFDLF